MKHTTLALALAITLPAGGCAAMRASQARQAHIAKATQAHTYEQPCADVWAAARTMLFAEDYQVKSADAAAGLTLETEWKARDNGTSVRYLFQGKMPTAASCQVVATRATKNAKGETAMDRDWQMEWNLIKQIDLPSANRIEAEAQQAGELARNSN
jgi:uncharacterized protein YceK